MSVKEKITKNKSVGDIIFETQKNISKLQKEYDSIKTSNVSTSSDRLKSLHSEYSKLKAEIKVLEESEPETIPKCKPLLFAWVYQVLQEDVKNLEGLLSFQKDMKKISSEKKLVLTKICRKEQIDCDFAEESFSFEELLENEKIKSEILQCLHRKLVRRLRRISRDYYHDSKLKIQNVDGNIPSKKLKKQKSMCSILKELFVELQDISATSEDWEIIRYIKVDKSNLQNAVELLLNYHIVEFSNEYLESIKLII